MPPIPCAHCGINFMRSNLDPEAPKLCNTCLVREEIRTNKRVNTVDTVEILIKCPRQTQIAIEEYCINKGIDFTKYFLSLHDLYCVEQPLKEEAMEKKQKVIKK